MKMGNKITIEEVEALGCRVESYDLERWMYKNDGVLYLVHKGEVVAKGEEVYSYDLDRWRYMEDCDWHYILKGKEVSWEEFYNQKS